MTNENTMLIGSNAPARDSIKPIPDLINYADLPTRILNYAEQRAICTLAELARIHPAQLLCERNLGRKTLAETRAVIERAFRQSWEELALGHSGATSALQALSEDGHAAASLPLWDQLQQQLPAALLERPLELTVLPARLRTYARNHGYLTIGELVRCSAAELTASDNLGRASVIAGCEALVALMQSVTDPARSVAAANWKSLLLEGLAMLDARERMVLTQRAGLAGPAPTLAELGLSFGVSRERIRQLETSAARELLQRAPWLSELTAQIGPLLPEFAVPLVELNDHGVALVHNEEEEREPFEFVLREVMGGNAGQVVVCEGAAYAGRCTLEVFAGALARLREAAASLAYPIAEELLPSALEALANLPSGALQALLPIIQVDFVLQAGMVVGFGNLRADAVRALLRRAGCGVAVAEINANCGRRVLPDDVVWLDRGLVTLPELVPQFDLWRARMPALVMHLMAEHGEDRQWTTAELLPLLGLVADLPEWINAHSLGSLLRNVDGLVYLGRNVVALPAKAPAERMYILDIAVGMLRAAGEPVGDAELLAAIRAHRGVADNTWTMLRLRAPFILLSEKQIGLFERDLPGGLEVAGVFCNQLADLLERKQRGLGGAELLEYVRVQPSPIASWDMQAARSVLRHDARFRQVQGGGVGLSVWGETRTPSQRTVLLALLAKTPKLPVEDALAELASASGEPLARNRIAALAAQCGARTHAGYIELMATLAPPPAPAVAESTAVAAYASSLSQRVPEKAAAALVLAMQSTRGPEALLEAIGLWQHELTVGALPGVDLAQVANLADRAQRLLHWLTRSASEEQRAAVVGAVEYLVCVEDGESDELVGGLDDDEAVIEAVEGELGVVS